MTNPNHRSIPPAAHRAPSSRPPAPVDADGALSFADAPAAPVVAPAAPVPSAKSTHFTLHFTLNGFPVEASFDGDLARLTATIARLQEIGAETPQRKAHEWSYTPDGLPICPKHGVPMRKRERQGDTWYSHNQGKDGEECYCRGYAGKDSPGWER